MTEKPKYEMTIDLNVLNHLGINLYSNVPAVLSEVVANSWDAEATKVNIDIDIEEGEIAIEDNGAGMTQEDINRKYLLVGYRKRDEEGTQTPNLKRHFMGRKGIGKLSLFSIANIIEVYSVKNGEKNGLILSADEIKAHMDMKKSDPYCPIVLNVEDLKMEQGTRIILKDLKKNLGKAAGFLRKRIARRFSVIGEEFGVFINGTPISIKDRDFFNKMEFVWGIGQNGQEYVDACANKEKGTVLNGVLDESRGLHVYGWIGTFNERKSMVDEDNKITILAWGKLIQEDILPELNEGGVYTKYLIGEINADFLDDDNQEDMVTSDRQSIKEDDPRYPEIKSYIKGLLKEIQNVWGNWRKEVATKKALENEAVKEWFERLTGPNKKFAQSLFSKIESFPVDDEKYRKELYTHGILAFESLARQEKLSMLEEIKGDEDFKLFAEYFSQIDELERVSYYQLVKGRMEVLRKFDNIVPESKEKVIQEYIFDHLWLLHPSWERASTNKKMEEVISKEIKGLDAKLTKEEKKARIDIRYKTAANKNIIIELKRYSASVTIEKLVDQVSKYRRTLEKCLKVKFPEQSQLIEIICILGSAPKPEDDLAKSIESLKIHGARYITYDDLIAQTLESYSDYIEKEKEISEIIQIIERI